MLESYRSVLQLDQNLRRLHLNDNNFVYLRIDMFNSFVQLEHLEIKCDRILFSSNGPRLILPNLKVFKWYDPNQHNARFKMNTPKLEALECHHLNTIELDHPETIKHLKIGLYQSKLEKFTNLEVLECEQIASINREILSSLNNLKVLSCYEMRPLYSRIGESENMVNKMSFIMKQKLVLRRTELKVYLQGVQLTDGNHLNDFSLNLRNTQFQIENYANLYSSLHFISYVNYNDLTRLMKRVPDDYFNKFFQIRMIEVTTKVNRDHFIRFVSKLKFVDSLKLTNASLDQSMIDNLIGFCDLKFLIVNEDQNLNLNFNCILKCKRLVSFRTNQPFQNSFDQAIKAFSRLTSLELFIFKKDDETVEIRKQFNFSLQCFRGLTGYLTFSKRGINFNELTTYCNHLANKTGVRTRRTIKLTRNRIG